MTRSAFPGRNSGNGITFFRYRQIFFRPPKKNFFTASAQKIDEGNGAKCPLSGVSECDLGIRRVILGSIDGVILGSINGCKVRTVPTDRIGGGGKKLSDDRGGCQ